MISIHTCLDIEFSWITRHARVEARVGSSCSCWSVFTPAEDSSQVLLRTPQDYADLETRAFDFSFLGIKWLPGLLPRARYYMEPLARARNIISASSIKKLASHQPS